MSERDTYPAGVPCWTTVLSRDVAGSVEFYRGLFGWNMDFNEAEDYAVGRMRGRDVAGVGSLAKSGSDIDPVWTTHVRVDSADDIRQVVEEAGGRVVAGPVDLSPAGRLSVIADPAGGWVCAWEAGTREGAQIINEPGAWAMSALETPDPQGTEEFYGSVFGWEAEVFGPPGSGVSLLRLPGFFGGEAEQPVPRDVVAVMMPPGGGGGGPEAQWKVDFWVDDADAASSKAAELGGRVIDEPHETTGFLRAVLADPEGASFSVSQLLRP